MQESTNETLKRIFIEPPMAVAYANTVIKRGYTDYRDFKKQLDAVDLLLLEPKEANAAYELFKTCHTTGLVRTQYQQEVINNGQLDVLEETNNGLR